MTLREQLERHITAHPEIVAAQVKMQLSRGLAHASARRDEHGRLVMTDADFEALLGRLLADGLMLGLYGLLASLDDVVPETP